MLQQLRTLVTTVGLLFALAVSATSASAQLKLPGKPPVVQKPEDKGDLTPHVDCNVCKSRTYNAPSSARVDESGNLLVWCSTCKRDTPHRSGVGAVGAGLERSTRSRSGDLRLPRARRVVPVKPTAEVPSETTTSVAPAPTSRTEAERLTARHSTPATTRIFDEVRRTRSLDSALLAQALSSLAAEGDAGLAAARAELLRVAAGAPSADAAPLVVATRLLLAAGAAEDHALVADRLRQKLPSVGCAILLNEFVARDPVRASPRYLADLLDHPQPAVRNLAARHLERFRTAELLVLLTPALASKRAETRLLAVDLASHVDDPAVTELLLARLDDASPRVATEAIAGLLLRHDEGLDARLVAIALGERWVLRRQACALLAIVEREDANLRAILDESHAEPLLLALESSDPFVRGACATALAGIGFRSANTLRTKWLEREVVDRLVSSISGQYYFDDFSLLSSPALRRLAQISAEVPGTDGPGWAAWWVAARERFQARRATITVGPDDAGELVVRVESRAAPSTSFALVGPSAGESWDASGTPTVYLTARETLDLTRALAADDVLGTRCLPGVRGARGPGARTLEVSVRGRAKAFTFGASVSEPWFERAYAAANAMYDRNLWQSFPDLSVAKTAHEFWKLDAAWWGGEHTDAERNARLKHGILNTLRQAAPALRDRGVAELARLYTDPANHEAADFALLCSLVAHETIVGERAHKLCDLALLAAGHFAEPAVGDSPVRASLALGRELCEAVFARFDAHAGPLLERIVAGSDRELARELATDARAALRTSACAALSVQPSEADVRALVKLLDDSEPTVQIAATRVLGDQRIEAARTELLVRARLAAPDLRAVALESIGKLGGEFVLDALVLGAADTSAIVRRGAALGLAELGDPTASQILVSMLTDAADGETFAAARAGLQKFGVRAQQDLLRVMNSPTHRGRREAALFLAELGAPESSSVLMQLLSTAPNDTRIASELAVLTCIDMRTQPDPAAAWWSWYDGVLHNDARSWFYAALERVGASPPPPGGLDGEGTPEGRAYLLSLLQRPETWLCERARREYARLIGRDPGPLPVGAEQREPWIRSLREATAEPRKL